MPPSGRVLIALACASAATAAPAPCDASEARVAVLGTEGAPARARLERNVRSLSLYPVVAAVTTCTRDVVTRLMGELEADTALCADEDAIAVWRRDGERIVLRDVVVATGADDRSVEVNAAAATMALRAAFASRGRPPETGGVTIIANGPAAGVVAGGAAAATGAPRETVAPPPPPLPSPRLAPALVVGAGPALAASRDGNSFALSFSAEIGFSRSVALVPWLNVIPANRLVERPEGTASFRPTLFGIGFSLPFLPPSSFVVPRLGAGYAMLWMHVGPEKATPPSTARSPEDLLAPALYATAALSFRIASAFRVAAEAFGGCASHDLVVRIGGRNAAHWGVPLGGLALRGEWVLP